MADARTSTLIRMAHANVLRARAELRAIEREAKALRRAEERERRIADETVMVLREDGPWRRVCLICSSEIVSICVRGSESGEIVRCKNGHDCGRRFKVIRFR